MIISKCLILDMEHGSRAKVHNLDFGEDITNWAIFTAAGQDPREWAIRNEG